MKKLIALFIVFGCTISIVFGQFKGQIAGLVLNKNTQNPIIGATIQIVNTPFVSITDSNGQYQIKNIPTGQYQIKYSSLGYLSYSLFNVIISSGNQNVNTIELIPQDIQLKEVIVGGNRKTARAATLETPLSVQKLSTEEIKASPGSNFDISKVVQTLPGITGSASTGAGFRNDIIVRGGAPNENVFYLDGIEIPVINHFSTQGSAGGPQGILNVSFIDEVKLSTSAFEAKYDNALSSVFEFKQKRGNPNKLESNIRLGATELASTFNGPLSKSGKTTFLVSARRSYLQYLFSAIDLPIRPNFWDFQYKITHQINPTTTFTTLGVGAIDELFFVRPRNASPEKLYALNANPKINQWSYTLGASLKKLIKKGYWNLSISRSHLNNNNEKFEDNLSEDKGTKTLDIQANEMTNAIRWDLTKSLLGIKWTTGLNMQDVHYDNSTYQILATPLIYNYKTDFSFQKYGAFFQLGKKAFNNRLAMSAGLRTDGNSFTQQGKDFAKTISPRISVSYVLNDQWNVNASVGRYYKLAPLTSLGFKDNNGYYANNNAAYVGSNHYVTGLEFLPSETTRFTAEVFYKQYFNAPISYNKGISLANLGADFNVLGNEAITTNGKGKSYGFELFAQQKLTHRFFGVASYSYFRSSYTNAAGQYIPSAWENRHLLSITAGYKLNNNWELGVKFRLQGGTPYTPYDTLASRYNFLTLGTGVFDYAKLNSLRGKLYHSSDIRIDKKYNFKKSSLDLFLDITNWYGSMSVAPPFYVFEANADGSFKTTDGKSIQQNGKNAITTLFNNNSVFITPTFGCIWEF